MKTRLIEALRTVARRLASDPSGYDWRHTGRCNCGLLAQELLGMTDGEVCDLKRTDASGAWTFAAEAGFCRKTQRPMAVIFTKLAEFGLGEADFAHLEWLGNPAVAARLGKPIMQLYRPTSSGWDDPLDVSRYMLAWADLLEEADLKEQDAMLEAYESRPLALTEKKAQPHQEAGPTMKANATQQAITSAI